MKPDLTAPAEFHGASPPSWRGFFFLYFLCVLIWLPLPLGSNRPWAWSLMEVLVLGGFAAALLISGSIRDSAANHMKRHPAWSGLFALWLAYLLLQLMPLAKDLLAVVAPATAELYRSAEPVTGERAWSIAIDRGAALDEWLKYAAYIILFYAVLIVANTRLRLTLLVGGLLAVGFAESLYAILLLAGGDALGLWRPPWLGHAVATGTFVNRNHFAAHLVMTFSLGLGLLMAGLRGRLHPTPGRSWASDALRLFTAPRLLLMLVLCIIAIALMLSQSRGALLSLAAGITLVALMSGSKQRSTGRRSALLAALVGLSLLGIGLWWVGSDTMLDRFSRLGAEGLNRIGLWRITLDMIADSPWVGFGAGNYPTMITAYRTADIDGGIINRAHNDYLELIADQGLIGSLIIGFAVLMVLGHIFAAYRRRRDALARGILFASLAACLTFLLHGLVDFNFRIPANAAYFFAILGIGVAAARMEGAHRTDG